MEEKFSRAEIIVSGIVQGVGFRWFVYDAANELGLNGFTENLSTGRVRTVVDGEKEKILVLYEKIKQGPPHARVEEFKITWQDYRREFDEFVIRRK